MVARGKCQRWTEGATAQHRVDHEHQFHPATSCRFCIRTQRYVRYLFISDLMTGLTYNRTYHDTAKHQYEPAFQAQTEIDTSQSKTSRTHLEQERQDRLLQQRSDKSCMVIGTTGVTILARLERAPFKTKSCCLLFEIKERSGRRSANANAKAVK